MNGTMNQTKRSLLIGGLLWLAAGTADTMAQVSLYTYSETVEDYTEISDADGGYSMGTPTWWPPLHNLRAFVDPNNPDGVVTNGGYLAPAIGPGYPIGFQFTYNGDAFDRVGIAHGGWISFGKSTDGNQAVVCFTSDHSGGRPLSHEYWATPLANDYQRNRIAGWGNSALRMQDMTQLVPPGPVSSLRIATIGTAPNRTCVIQWKDFRGEYSPSSSLINYQIRLHETTNVVEIRFGNNVWQNMNMSVQIGLGGRTNQDFNNRMTVYEQPAFLYDWNQTVAGTSNTDNCYAISEQPGQPNGTGVGPVEGRTFRWTPPTCPAPAWPLALSNIAFNGGLVSWPSTGSDVYDYFVSSDNSTTGPEVASGTVEGPEVYIEGLDPMTTYYVFVRSYCDGEPGEWGLGTPLKTYGGGFLACPGTPMESSFCSAQYSTYYWHYVSDDGFSPVKIDFLDGFIGTVFGESFGIWNGDSADGPADFSPTGDLTGQTFTSTGPQIFIRLVTDAGACEAQPWYLPLQWRVGCKNCTDPLATYSVVDVDCENNEFFVDVDLFSMGTATSLIVQNSLGLPNSEITSAGIHTVGPFEAGTSVTLTVENSVNASCYVTSTSLVNAPCVLVDCGPTEHTLCYGDNEVIQRAYQGADGQEIGIRFLAGTMGIGDQGSVYNSADPEEVTPVSLQSSGGLMNGLYTSGAPSVDRTLILEVVSDNAHSCADEDAVFGVSEEWRYVVACYDGCVQPQATFALNCLTQTQYEVNVTITQAGSGSVSITNNGGAPTVAANQLGTYTVGPFTAGTPVTLEVEGASVLCSWTSPGFNPDCTGVGIEELQVGDLRVYPNPNNGSFRVELPENMGGAVMLQVIDLAGRSVATEAINANATITVDLAQLPAGLYTVLATAGHMRSTAKVSIQH